LSDTGLDAKVTYYYKVAAYDTFGKDYAGTGLNLSSEISGTTEASAPPSGAALPGTATVGEIFYNTTDQHLYEYTSTGWKLIANNMTANSITAANGFIANAAVVTLSIAGNAVTVPASSYTSGSISIPNSWTTLASDAIDSEGESVVIVASCSFRGLDRGEYRILETSTVLYNSGAMDVDNTQTAIQFCATALATPGSGTKTYYLQGKNVQWSSQDIQASARAITVLGAKR